MARDFYPFVEEGTSGARGAGDAGSEPPCEVHHPARVAVYDDASAAPRVVVIEPCDVRDYLEQITATVNRLSHEQGGTIPFMVIREIVENFIHAYFQAPTITILDGGNTIRFSDQGPGIKEKSLALEYGTSSATEEMKRYIRGVGSGLPYVQQYMSDKGGSLEIEDNIAGGTVVTISTHPREEARAVAGVGAEASGAPTGGPQAGGPQAVAAPGPWVAQPQQTWPAQQGGWPQAGGPWQQPAYPQQAWAQPYPQQGYPATGGQPYPPVGGAAMSVPAAQAPQPMPPTGATGMTAAAAGPAPVQPDERGAQVLAFLATHEAVGPTDLVHAYGSSGPTWSRALASLAAQGLVMKSGQKYQLTAFGRTFV